MSVKEVKEILVLITGGTLNMKDKGKGLAPTSTKDLEDWLQKCGILQKQDEHFTMSGKANIACTIESTKELVDSSNIEIKDWTNIAKQLEGHYNNYDGFVIVHGTDTMVYTASALSFILGNLQKPVVLTGAQIPVYNIGSDGENNFKSSLCFAAFAANRIPEVVICFNNKIFRGNRTSKKDCVRYDAYESPNYPVLATVDNEGRIEVSSDEYILLNRQARRLEIKDMSNSVCLLKLYPGITKTIVEKIMEGHRGVVLETYGAGNAPNDLSKAFKEEKYKDKIVVNVTQCLRGGVTMSYETGRALKDAGVIPCGDMTTSAAFTKLCYLLGNTNLTREDIAKEMTRNLNGEITDLSRNRN